MSSMADRRSLPHWALAVSALCALSLASRVMVDHLTAPTLWETGRVDRGEHPEHGDEDAGEEEARLGDAGASTAPAAPIVSADRKTSPGRLRSESPSPLLPPPKAA